MWKEIIFCLLTVFRIAWCASPFPVSQSEGRESHVGHGSVAGKQWPRKAGQRAVLQSPLVGRAGRRAQLLTSLLRVRVPMYTLQLAIPQLVSFLPRERLRSVFVCQADGVVLFRVSPAPSSLRPALAQCIASRNWCSLSYARSCFPLPWVCLIFSKTFQMPVVPSEVGSMGRPGSFKPFLGNYSL